MYTPSRPSGCDWPCWGRQFEDSSSECRTCPYQVSCKGAMLSSHSPITAPPPITPPPPFSSSGTRLPIATSSPQPISYVPAQTVYSNPLSSHAQSSAYSQQQNWQYPSLIHVPNPAPMPVVRNIPEVGDVEIDPYRNLYPFYHNESTAKRLGKNIVLKGMETVFGELSRFFKFWSWPSGN